MDSLALANTKINLNKAFNNFFRDEYVVVQKKKNWFKVAQPTIRMEQLF
ncbi:hypothetical protein GVK97_12585 [Enterococcus hirae]|nr:hypothetical protein [Enterococcus hirae]